MSKKTHAERNERLCLTLLEQGEYHDWVVTTSFYSALHFVQHEIFPLNDGRREYGTFDSYYNSIGHNKVSKHKLTIQLVREHLPDAAGSYKWLHDTCITARYQNYAIPDRISAKAVEHLNKIKEVLVK